MAQKCLSFYIDQGAITIQDTVMVFIGLSGQQWAITETPTSLTSPQWTCAWLSFHAPDSVQVAASHYLLNFHWAVKVALSCITRSFSPWHVKINSSSQKVAELFFPGDITFYLAVLFLPAWNCSVWQRERCTDTGLHKRTDLSIAEWLLGPCSYLTQKTSSWVPLRRSTCWPRPPRTLTLLWVGRAWQPGLRLSPLRSSHSWWLWPPYWFCVLTRHLCSICWHWLFLF